MYVFYKYTVGEKCSVIKKSMENPGLSHGSRLVLIPGPDLVTFTIYIN